jgi:hypothetical protein
MLRELKSAVVLNLLHLEAVPRLRLGLLCHCTSEHVPVKDLIDSMKLSQPRMFKTFR